MIENTDAEQIERLNSRIVELLRERDVLVKALEMFLCRMVEYGNWEDGCFYYNRLSASELQEPIDLAKVALRAKP